MLDLEKIDYIKFEKEEVEKCEYQNLEQDISRSWRYLQNTHNLNNNEMVCIRALVYREKWDAYAYNHELVINAFDDYNYNEYKKFIEKHIKYKRVYNFFYNVYKTDVRKVREFIREEENQNKFYGRKENISGTDILIVDFDNCNKEDYINIKNLFEEKGIYTTSILSGHGYHFVIYLKETCYDELVLSKFLYCLKKLGLQPDSSCSDTARIMRLPFFYNQKVEKYGNKSIKSTILTGEYHTIKYDLEDVFQKLGFQYKEINLEKEYKEKKKYIYKKYKKEKQEKTYKYNDDVDLYKTYQMLNINILPIGIKNMLRGFKKGYSNNIVLIITLYFKKHGLDLEDIIEILSITESINSNDWNYWNLEEEVTRIYNNYDYINKFLLTDMEEEFGPIDFFNKEDLYKIPINCLKPGELKLYLYFLMNDDKKKKDILEDVKISNNKFDRLIKNKFVKCDNNYKLNVEFTKYCLLNEMQIKKLLGLNEKEISIYLYFRCGIKNEISTSIESIKKYTFISEHTISDAIKSLENKNIIDVRRNHYIKMYDKKESNTYKLRVF